MEASAGRRHRRAALPGRPACPRCVPRGRPGSGGRRRGLPLTVVIPGGQRAPEDLRIGFCGPPPRAETKRLEAVQDALPPEELAQGPIPGVRTSVADKPTRRPRRAASARHCGRVRVQPWRRAENRCPVTADHLPQGVPVHPGTWPGGGRRMIRPTCSQVSSSRGAPTPASNISAKRSRYARPRRPERRQTPCLEHVGKSPGTETERLIFFRVVE